MSLATSISTGVAEHGLAEVDLQLVLEIRAAKHLRAPAATAATAEDVAEHLAEHFAEGVGARVAAAPPPPWREASMPACPCWS